VLDLLLGVVGCVVASAGASRYGRGLEVVAMRRMVVIGLAMLVVAGCARQPTPEIEVGETVTTTSTDDTSTTLRRGPAPGWEPARKPSATATTQP
jgi:hypothetical protein